MKILGYDYTFDYSANCDSMEAAGRCHPKTQVIQIANDMAVQMTQATVLHEIIEAVKYNLGLDISHNAVMALGTSLYQVLVDAGVDLSPLTKELFKDDCVDDKAVARTTLDRYSRNESN